MRAAMLAAVVSIVAGCGPSPGTILTVPSQATIYANLSDYDKFVELSKAGASLDHYELFRTRQAILVYRDSRFRVLSSVHDGVKVRVDFATAMSYLPGEKVEIVEDPKDSGFIGYVQLQDGKPQ